MGKKIRISEQDLSSIIAQNVLGGDISKSFQKLIQDLKSGSFGSSELKSTKSEKLPDYKGSINFKDVTHKIIDTLEGGYYHPDMLKDGRVKDSRYGGSTETMYGMDRFKGKTESTAAGREFWRLIDKENARKNWKWNYMLEDNPTLANKLKDLIVEIMEPNFNDYMKRYLSPEARELVKSNPKLYFNFAYATWNGPGWFERFAKDFNQKVKAGFSDQEDLVQAALDRRKNSSNSLMSQGGKKIEKILSSMG